MWYVIDVAAGPNVWLPIVTTTLRALWLCTMSTCSKGPCTLNNCMSNPYQVYESGQPSISFGLQIVCVNLAA